MSNTSAFVSGPISGVAIPRAGVFSLSSTPINTRKVTVANLPQRCKIVADATGAEPTVVTSVTKASRIDTMEKFWTVADDAKLNTEYTSDNKLEFLKDASADEVRKVCIQYRYFVHNYPDNLTHLVRKIPYGGLKSLISEILAEELGSGHQADAHIIWYDRFLKSIGITDEQLATALYPENSKLLDEIEARCESNSYEYVTGVIGMGGECLCQVYLTNMYKYLLENKWIQSMNDQIDWHFWTYHTGEEDIAHRELVRKAINHTVKDSEGVKQLAAGYEWGKNVWDEFWTNNYKDTKIAKN